MTRANRTVRIDLFDMVTDGWFRRGTRRRSVTGQRDGV
jgi:hypothetical protein